MAGVNKETDSCVLGASTLGGEVDGSSRSPVISQKPRQHFKKKSRKLCRKFDRRQTGDHKRSTFDHDQYHITMVTNQVSAPSNVTMATSTSNRGHSTTTKAEVKKMNQHLIDENLRLKKDFHKADHRLKTLLADKNDFLRRLRLESKATNKLIESIHDETKDVMKRAQDILTKAARQKKETEFMVDRSKKDTELLMNEIERDRTVLVKQRRDLKKRSASLKKKAASTTATHKRCKIALAQERSENQQIIEDQKEHWKTTIRLAEKKMMYSLKQLQKERMMWQVLRQEAELRCEDSQLAVHRQKSNDRTLVQMQVNRAIRKERELKSYMLELQEMHKVQLLQERKAKRVTIQSSKHW